MNSPYWAHNWRSEQIVRVHNKSLHLVLLVRIKKWCLIWYNPYISRLHSSPNWANDKRIWTLTLDKLLNSTSAHPRNSLQISMQLASIQQLNTISIYSSIRKLRILQYSYQLIWPKAISQFIDDMLVNEILGPINKPVNACVYPEWCISIIIDEGVRNKHL